MIYILIPHTPDRRERLRETIDSIHANTDGIDYCIVTFENDYGGWARSLLNMMDGIHGLAIILESDTVVEEGWLRVLLDNYKQGFILEPYNELHNGTLCQHPFGHTDLLKKYLNPDYFHSFADNEFHDRAVADGVYRYVPESRIEHRHYVNGKAPNDASYQRIYSPEVFEKDRELYQQRKQSKFL